MLLYRLLSVVALAAYAPYALIRSALGRRRLGDIAGRLGRRPYPDLSGGMWVHAVSVGEVGVARTLISALAAAAPDRRAGLSTTTEAGSRLAAATAGPAVPVFAFPFDLASPVERAFDGVRPGLVVLTETEIWPLFLQRAARRGIPVALVNGRISKRSFSRYRSVRRWLGPALEPIRLFAMQSQADAERIERLGAPSTLIRVTGNLKYDLPEPSAFPDATRLRRAAAGRPVFVAASTAEGEEEAVVEAWLALRERPLLALAPRRPERFDDVARMLGQRGLRFLRRSREATGLAESSRSAGNPGPGVEGPPGVYLLDSIGELASLYAEAAIAFVGGSLAPRGGHNPIEAWAAGVPVLTGPHTENFRDVSEEGERRDFLHRVSGRETLSRALADSLSAREETVRRGAAARAFVAENRGAARRTAELLLPLLEHEEKKTISR